MSEQDLELVVTRMQTVAQGVVELTLSRSDGGELPAWEAGGHVDLHFVSNGRDFVRQYSLCGRVDDRRRWQVAVLRAPDGRGGSAHIHDVFDEGQRVRVTGPRNNFPLVKSSRYLFIAGGIGITPMMPMLAQVRAAGADWRLVYCGRTKASMAFVDEIGEFGADRVRVHESDRLGLLDLPALLSTTDADTAIYCCGPESMLRAIDVHCASWTGDRVHVEHFGRREGAAVNADTEFEVEFARSGLLSAVPVGRSILEVAEELGVDIDSSCQEGVCGSCETRVLCGTPDHRDSILGEKERAAGQTMSLSFKA
jgi:ferredoxin-NADP reductase